jgi:AcrR family transcriptional regulator
VSLAAIGYHYGTKDHLLNAALRQALAGWGDDMGKALATTDRTDPAGRFEAMWTQVIRSFADNHRLWAVQFELLGFLDREPELKAAFAQANEQAQAALAELFGIRGEAVGAVFRALIGGMAAQWLVAPDNVPTGAQLRAAVGTIAAAVA